MRLNLGCGTRTMAGAINVDRVAGPGVDQVWDLDQAPWPWDTGVASSVHARDVFEHVGSAITFMSECHRVLKPGGNLWIRTPNITLSLGDAFTDPTHKRFPTWETFDYWIEGTRYFEEHNGAYSGIYGPVVFTLKDRRPDDGSMIVVLRRAKEV